MSGEKETHTLTSGKFRRRATVVEARRLTQENIKELLEWTEGRYWSQPPMRAVSGIAWPHPVVDGEDEVAEFGDWVVQLGDGNFRVWEDDRFRESYEPVVDEASELRAAAREWREAARAESEAHKAWTDAIAAQPPLTEYIKNWQKAKDRKDDAVAALRRLADGENDAKGDDGDWAPEPQVRP